MTKATMERFMEMAHEYKHAADELDRENKNIAVLRQDKQKIIKAENSTVQRLASLMRKKQQLAHDMQNHALKMAAEASDD